MKLIDSSSAHVTHIHTYIKLTLSDFILEFHQKKDRKEVLVTDSMGKTCVDPGETGTALQAGGIRGPGPPVGEEGGAVGVGQWKGKDVKEMLQNLGEGLDTTSSCGYA
jgi:hypothetical protein